ncbi:MAG: hypothetical protein NWF04_03165 [Candidatus Bathyarchaeota archaeon]|nr:hypothetical protein [Candidatus Bathyarchaeota archaeon]
MKPEKIDDFSEFAKKYLRWREKCNPDLYREVKNHLMIDQTIDAPDSGSYGGYIEIWEYENLSDCDKCWSRILEDEELMTQVYPEFARFLAPETHSIELLDTEKTRHL